MNKSILAILGNSVADFRITFAAQALTAADYEVETISAVPLWKIAYHDAIIVQRPGLEMLGFVDAALASGKPVIIDMDDDFNSIPKASPAYAMVGKGRKDDYLKRLNDTIARTTCLTVTSEEISRRYNRPGIIIPNAYDNTNPHWQAPKISYGWAGLTIGWAGSLTHRADFAAARESIVAFLADNPDVRIAIGADPEIYRSLGAVPERQKLFLMGMNYADYPAMWRMWDIALAPLEANDFNAAKSDIKLVEAGARGIPWIASAVQPYVAWGVGGLLVEPTAAQDFYTPLAELCASADLRARHGAEGHAKALDERNAGAYGQRWVNLVDATLKGK